MRRTIHSLSLVLLILLIGQLPVSPTTLAQSVQNRVYLPSLTRDFPKLNVRSYKGMYEGTSYTVVGEVENTGPSEAYRPHVIITYYDSNGTTIAGDNLDAFLIRIGPGEVAPFRHTLLNMPSGVTRVGFFLERSDNIGFIVSPIAIVSYQVQNTNGGETVVTLRNNRSGPFYNVVIAVTFYDATGSVVGADQLEQHDDLNPGEERIYQIPLSRPGLVYDHVTVQAQGDI